MQGKHPNTPINKRQIVKVQVGKATMEMDAVAIEDPLEIKLLFQEANKKETLPLAITMRTPGADHALVYGYLFTEGIIGKKEDVIAWKQLGNTVHIQLDDSISKASIPFVDRPTITHASCGICGKPSLDSIEKISCHHPIAALPKVPYSILTSLPNQLLQIQNSFTQTGGMHAAALYQSDGSLLAFQEDIGRHNALDKLMGWALLLNAIPLRQHILLLSGRISFELVQKASLAGIPIIAAVGAPSNLAIELAEANGITLVGFIKADRFNIYCGAERVDLH